MTTIESNYIISFVIVIILLYLFKKGYIDDNGCVGGHHHMEYESSCKYDINEVDEGNDSYWIVRNEFDGWCCHMNCDYYDRKWVTVGDEYETKEDALGDLSRLTGEESNE